MKVPEFAESAEGSGEDQKLQYGRQSKMGIYTYNKDAHFTSASMAVSFVTGASTNGMTAWKTKGGKTLKEAGSN